MSAMTPAYLCARVDHVAAERPDAIALSFGGTDLSYSELARQSTQLAERLNAHRLPASGPVMVTLARSPELIVSLLALWRCGLTYLPVDPRDPEQRLNEIRSVTGAVATISQPVGGALDSTELSLVAHVPERDIPAPDPGEGSHSAPAYVIFTSGSTGRPKGIAASHEALDSLLGELVDRYDIAPEDSVLQFAAPTFDTSIEQIGVALAAGARLVLPDVLWAPSEFHDRVTAAGVTVMDLTPSYWREVASHMRGRAMVNDDIRVIILGGAAVTNADLQATVDLFPQARVLNAYGLTETGITSCLSETDRSHLRADGPAAVGWPLDGVEVAVLDPAGNPVEEGLSGAVALAGRLALGTTNGGGELSCLPTVSLGEKTFYLTGDTGYIDPACGLHITGRTDRQLKIRGFRVDPEEIENALRCHPDVSDVAVVSNRESTRLHAFYTLGSTRPDPGAEALLNQVRGVLPTHAVPNTAVAVAELPQTAHGKTDYRALIASIDQSTRASSNKDAKIDSAIDRAVANVWTGVLGITDDQLGKSFFDAGGTSVDAAELVARTRATLGIHIRFVRALIEQLLKDPHFSSYCRAVEKARSGALAAGSDPSQAMQADLQRTIELGTERPSPAPPCLDDTSTILLTGATGFLGSHLVPRLLDQTPARVACLVRASSEDAARQRLEAAWENYGSAEDITAAHRERIDIVVGDLAQPCLGLGDRGFEELTERTDLVIHSGGTVNFIYPYAEMKAANVDGTYELLRLAATHGVPFHHVSTMAVIAGHGTAGARTISETAPLGHLDQLGVGYAESKWVAEHLVQGAGSAGLPVAIYRAADISGHSERGTWNTSTEMCCMKRFIRDVGAIPRAELPMDYTPVDVYADALVHIATQEPADGRVYHLTNPNKSHISVLQERLEARGHEVGEVSWDEWVARMIDLAVADPEHPMTPFAPLFIDRCPSGQMSVAEMYLEDTFPVFSRTNVERALAGTDISFPDVDADLIDRYLDFMERKDFL